ncbi:MAG TPA: tetratricopeptide repeat protein [Polyangia bacterium]|jgi:hypothetical protein|nr:tetratricopeptide repeat protein [Polyangia bacterium]
MKGLLCGLSLLLSIVLGGSARGDETAGGGDAETRARQHMHQGLARAAVDDLAGALDEYRAAYALAPTLKRLYNLAQVERALNHPLEALRHYETFLEGARAANDSAELTVGIGNAEEAVADLRANAVGRIDAVAEPGVQVLVDGEPRGATPLAAPVDALPGLHSVAFRRGGREQNHEIQVAAGRRARIDGTLVLQVSSPGPVSGSSPRTQDPGPGVGISNGTAPAPPARPPIYKRWYFWSAAALVLIGGGVAIYAAMPQRPACAPSMTSTSIGSSGTFVGCISGH